MSGKPSPATLRALELLAEQERLADALDAGLAAADAARVQFEAGGRALEAFVRGLARGAGFDAGPFEYDGAMRFRLWLRSRSLDSGFAAVERQHLERLRDSLVRVEEVIHG